MILVYLRTIAEPEVDLTPLGIEIAAIPATGHYIRYGGDWYVMFSASFILHRTFLHVRKAESVPDFVEKAFDSFAREAKASWKDEPVDLKSREVRLLSADGPKVRIAKVGDTPISVAEDGACAKCGAEGPAGALCDVCGEGYFNPALLKEDDSEVSGTT